jgi:hypothetical protein
MRRLRELARRRPPQRLRLLAPHWYEAKYGIDHRDAERHYLTEGHALGFAPTPLFDVGWYAEHYGAMFDAPLVDFEQNAATRTPNRWLDPRTLQAAGVAAKDVVEHLAAARIRMDDPRTLSPADSAILRVWPGRRSVGQEVVILAHYDAPGRVSRAFVALLEAFVATGRPVVVCSTSIDEGEGLEEIRSMAHAVCAVPNTGHDWGAYQAGLRFALEELAPSSVVLANDSVYVVSERLTAFLDRLADLGVDLAGATDSEELSPHLQSYLLRLGPRALSGPLVDELLATYVPVAEKELVIHMYELGVSRRAREHRLSTGAVHPVRELENAAMQRRAATESVLRRIDSGIPVTPTLHLWRPLIEDGFPFVKRQLLRDGMAPPELLAGIVPETTLAFAEADLAARRESG